MITQENINEAETLIEWYFPDAYPFSAGSGYLTGELDTDSQRRFACRIAIKDRESVLRSLKKLDNECEGKLTMIAIDKMYANLQQQIEYLKSKLT